MFVCASANGSGVRSSPFFTLVLVGVAGSEPLERVPLDVCLPLVALVGALLDEALELANESLLE